MPTLLINLYGAPCSGKSIKMMQLAVHAKLLGIFCEISAEVAKEYVVQKIPITREIQLALSAEQARRLHCFVGHTQAVITDAPIMIGAYYSQYRNLSQSEDLAHFQKMAADLHAKAAKIINLYIWRKHPYEERGRLETESEHHHIATEMYNFVKHHTKNQPLLEAQSTDTPAELWTRIESAKQNP